MEPIASHAKVKMAALVSANAATTATAIIEVRRCACPSAATTPTVTTTTGAAIPAPRLPRPRLRPPLLSQWPASRCKDCVRSPTRTGRRDPGRHEGVDIIAKAGQWIYAVNDGTLTRQYFDAPGSLSGNGWRLTVAGGTYFFYAHLSSFAPGLSVGSA